MHISALLTRILLKDETDICPECGAQAEATDHNTNGNRHYINMRCAACNGRWALIYGLDGIVCGGGDNLTYLVEVMPDKELKAKIKNLQAIVNDRVARRVVKKGGGRGVDNAKG